MMHPNYREKACILCHSIYKPSSGPQKVCHDCIPEYQKICVRRYNNLHPDKLKEFNRKWYDKMKKNPEWRAKERARKNKHVRLRLERDPVYRKNLWQRNKDTARLTKETAKLIAKCKKCGNGWPLQCDHIDGNPYNHSLDNLQWLCESCHMQKHGFQTS